MKEITFKTEQEWLDYRNNGLGGTDASSIIGRNPYKNIQELYDLKIGTTKSEDISSKPAVKYGKEAEEPLRELFKLDFPQYEVIHKPFTIYIHDEFPFLLGSFDGILADRETGEMKILEVKTTNILQSMQREKWNDRIPDNYFIQVLQYLLVSGYSEAILVAQLKSTWGGEMRKTTRHYTIKRDDHLADIEMIKNSQIRFWKQNIEKRIRPSLILPNI